MEEDKKEFNYMNDLEINRDELDKEFMQQPIIYMTYQELLVGKEKEKNNCKLAIDVLEAGIDKEIRETGEKLSEVKIKNIITADPRRIEKMVEYYDLIEEYGLLGGAVKSFEQRKKSLEKLTDLYLNGYFSAVKQKNSDDTRIKNKKGENE